MNTLSSHWRNVNLLLLLKLKSNCTFLMTLLFTTNTKRTSAAEISILKNFILLNLASHCIIIHAFLKLTWLKMTTPLLSPVLLTILKMVDTAASTSLTLSHVACMVGTASTHQGWKSAHEKSGGSGQERCYWEQVTWRCLSQWWLEVSFYTQSPTLSMYLQPSHLSQSSLVHFELLVMTLTQLRLILSG